MKIKTNIRAGKQNRKGSDNPPETEVEYTPPVSRCPGY